MNNEQLNIINEFQCPGCVSGPNPETCPAFQFIEQELCHLKKQIFFHCESHCPRTVMAGIDHIYLGLPKGFDKVGFINPNKRHNIRLFLQQPTWDYLNVPVWAMIKDGFMFVRTHLPRLNQSYVDVIKLEKGQKDLPEGAIDVSTFIDEID